MITEDQSEVVAFLSAPSTYGGLPVERVDTHASIVFLAGARAWKLKRAVRYDYLDFSTAERRRTMCHAEVRANRRTAPQLYRGVVPVTKTASGALSIGGVGEAVDWLVEMERFDQDGLFDRLAERQALELELMRPLASAIAALHRVAAPRRDHGGRAGMAWVIDGNAAGLEQEGGGILDPSAVGRLTAALRHALERDATLLDARRRDGFVRECHGDLHLRNVVLLEGRPTLFDAIEFNDEIACVDVLYDVAFLLMDLWRRGLKAHANAVWNAYLEQTGDWDAIALMPLFLSCRAEVRAKISATAAALQRDARQRAQLSDEAREYLGLAEDLLVARPACVVAIGGFSGSGKSTLARALAPAMGVAPGAIVIRTDEIRKRLLGVDPFQRLGADGYTSDVSRRVYAIVVERAAAVARSGYVAVADAVFARATDREAIRHAAAAAGVPFSGMWLDAPEPVLVDRLAHRVTDASDADATVIRQQLAQDTGMISWQRIDASADLDAVTRRAAGLIEATLAGGVHSRTRTA